MSRKLLILALCVLLTGCSGTKSQKNETVNQEEETEVARIDSFNITNIDEIDVYINAGTAAGNSETIKKSDDATKLQAVVNELYPVDYSETIRNYTDEEYDFSITYVSNTTNEAITIYYMEDCIFRIDKTFYAMESGINESIIEKIIK